MFVWKQRGLCFGDEELAMLGNDGKGPWWGRKGGIQDSKRAGVKERVREEGEGGKGGRGSGSLDRWEDVYEVAPAITFPCEWPRPEGSCRGLVPGGYFWGLFPEMSASLQT